MNEPIITMIGNLTADPELRATQNGHQVANFTVAQTPRTFDRQANEWKDGEAVFMRCSVWRELAEHVASSLTKGMRVIVSGRLTQRSFTDKEGANRTALELEVDEIGPSLKYATAQVTRAQSGQQQGQQQGNFQQQGQQQAQGYGAPQQGYGPPQGQQGFQPQTQGMPQQPQQGGFPQQAPPQQPMQGQPPQQPMPTPQNPGWGNGQQQAFPGMDSPF